MLWLVLLKIRLALMAFANRRACSKFVSVVDFRDGNDL